MKYVIATGAGTVDTSREIIHRQRTQFGLYDTAVKLANELKQIVVYGKEKNVMSTSRQPNGTPKLAFAVVPFPEFKFGDRVTYCPYGEDHELIVTGHRFFGDRMSYNLVTAENPGSIVTTTTGANIKQSRLFKPHNAEVVQA